jgi:hypothetical protein
MIRIIAIGVVFVICWGIVLYDTCRWSPRKTSASEWRRNGWTACAKVLYRGVTLAGIGIVLLFCNCYVDGHSLTSGRAIWLTLGTLEMLWMLRIAIWLPAKWLVVDRVFPVYWSSGRLYVSLIIAVLVVQAIPAMMTFIGLVRYFTAQESICSDLCNSCGVALGTIWSMWYLWHLYVGLEDFKRGRF